MIIYTSARIELGLIQTCWMCFVELGLFGWMYWLWNWDQSLVKSIYARREEACVWLSSLPMLDCGKVFVLQRQANDPSDVLNVTGTFRAIFTNSANSGSEFSPSNAYPTLELLAAVCCSLTVQDTALESIATQDYSSPFFLETAQ